MSECIQCVVMFNYEAKQEDELDLRVGDMITRVVKRKGGWWHGKLRDKEGVFPENFVRTLPTSKDKVLLRSNQKFKVKCPYKLVNVDELELVAGQVVEVVEGVEDGWWKGKIEDRLGVFPSSFVSGPLSEADLAKPALKSSGKSTAIPVTPVVLRRNSSKIRSNHASLDQNFPISANLFDPEDEPLGPLFGSLSSQLEQDWTTSSLRSCSQTKPGLFNRIRHSFSGKTLLPKFLSSRLSSGSLFDTRSICSPIMNRRNSFAAFFKRSSPSAASSKQDLKETCQLDQNFRSWDPVTQPGLKPLNSTSGLKPINSTPRMKPLSSTPVIKLEGDFRKVSLSCESKRIGRDPEQSLSWVWQELGSKTAEFETPTNTRRPLISSGDSGVGESESRFDTPEEVFGPVMDITDEVFEDMFHNSKNSTSNLRSPIFSNSSVFVFSEALEENLQCENQITPSKIRTSFSSIDPNKEPKRNSTPTNPFVSWKSNEKVKKYEKVQITEL